MDDDSLLLAARCVSDKLTLAPIGCQIQRCFLGRPFSVTVGSHLVPETRRVSSSCRQPGQSNAADVAHGNLATFRYLSGLDERLGGVNRLISEGTRGEIGVYLTKSKSEFLRGYPFDCS